jgi:hypothetical protein
MRIVYLVWHEWKDSDDYEYPEWHKEVVKVFDSEDKAKNFVFSKPYHDTDHYTYGPRNIE